MKVIVCGDSFNCNDALYPGVHWTEKIVQLNLNDEIVLQTCETELVWNNNNQSGRHCLYKVTGIE